jgi:hypothetical protein
LLLLGGGDAAFHVTDEGVVLGQFSRPTSSRGELESGSRFADKDTVEAIALLGCHVFYRGRVDHVESSASRQAL